MTVRTDASAYAAQKPLGAMVVAGPEGFRKGQYRKWNIKRDSTTPGDDYAMMREVFHRRFARAIEEDPERTKGEWPDLVLIDEAHLRGLMVMLDVVYNHFGPDGNYLGLYSPQYFTDRFSSAWGAGLD